MVDFEEERQPHDFLTDIHSWTDAIAQRTEDASMRFAFARNASIALLIVSALSALCLLVPHYSSYVVVRPDAAHLQHLPLVLFAFAVLSCVSAAIVHHTARLNFNRCADRAQVETLLLSHREALRWNPDAQKIFAAYDARRALAVGSATIRGPSVLV